MTFKSFIRLSSCLSALALVSACAKGPQISASNEAGQYRSHAGRSYTPPGPASDPWGPYIREASGKYDVPETWVREVMRQESGGRLYGRGGDLITSGAGAMGLMQVMPATYDDLRARYRELGDDPFDPHNNILAGTAYIREMYDIYGSPGFLAAYNAGPGRLDDYLTRNRTLPQETRRYVASIGPRIAGAEPQRSSPGAQFAMNALPFSIPDGPRYSPSSRYSAPPAPVVDSAPPVVVADAGPLPPATPISGALQHYAPLPGPAPVQAPVEVAEAPAVEPLRHYAPLPGPAPQAFAQAEVPAFRPAPAAAPAYTPSYAPAYTPSYAPAVRGGATSFMPEPPRPPVLASREPAPQRMAAAAALVPLSPARAGFSLVSPANAEPIGRRPAAGYAGGGWAVQVGAYANGALASSATTTAREHVRDVLGPAHSSVTPVHSGNGTLYRARLTGLSRDAAAQACERLSRARTSCMVVSPDAQL